MQPERDENIKISDALFGRLSSRGLTPIEIPRLIKDVYNIIGNGGHFTVASVNKDLKRLGWSERTMDTICFELIVFLLENEGDYQVERHMLH
jgi:hypothetical protein